MLRSCLVSSTLLACIAFVTACPSDDDATPAPDAGRRDAGGRDAATVGRDATGGGDAMLGTDPLAIGTGITDYEPIDDGAELSIVMGAQGGYHVDLTFRACGIAAMDARLRVFGFDPVTEEEVAFEVDRILTDRRVRLEEDGCWVRVGDLLVFDVTGPDEIVGRDVRIDARLIGVDGTEATASKVVRVVE
ncbi:MAG: hypothetical protein H6723_18830 [Sandaracinus sp.]|nr:hypothetical protein [Sandaracinus sp.]